MIGSSFGQQLAQYQTSFLVEEKILAAAATSVTFSNLNALRDGGYTIDILAISNTTGQPNINLIVNGDTNAANYTGRMMYASSNSALGLATTNRISSLAPSVGQLCATFTDVAFAGGKISAYTRATDQFPEVFVVGTQYTPTVSNITSLTIECATASGLAAGTIIRLYRKLNGNTAAFAPLQSNLVADILVPTNTTQVDITGLDCDLHGGYNITVVGKGIQATQYNLGMYFNDDLNNANYSMVYTQGYGASSIGGGTVALSFLGYLTTNGQLTSSVDIFARHTDGPNIYQTQSFFLSTTSALYNHNCSVRYNPSFVNITKLSFVSALSSGIGAGSRIRVYRRK